MMSMRAMVIAKNWALNLARFVLGKTDYLTVFPPFFASAVVYSRKKRRLNRFTLRPGTADVLSFIEIFQKENYRVNGIERLADIVDTYQRILRSGRCPLIIDCGANNGLSACYFADVWPEAKIFALEPDAGNIEMIHRNTASLDIDVLQAGISSETKRLSIVNRNAVSNSFRTTEDDGGAIRGVTIADIVESFDPALFSPFLVKIDIEGFESDLFARNTAWIDATPVLAIELHDWMLPGEANSRNFLCAIAARNRDFVCCGEIILSIRNHDTNSKTRFSRKKKAAMAQKPLPA